MTLCVEPPGTILKDARRAGSEPLARTVWSTAKGAGLLEAPLPQFGIRGELGRRELESYEAVEFEVLKIVDHAPAPATEGCENVVVGSDFADHRTPAGRCMIPTARCIRATAVKYSAERA
jgi:hypothetical protein